MYQHILLLMDCSPVDDAIIRHVVELARIHGSTVHLFHVVHAHTLDQRRALTEKATACIDEARAAFIRNQVSVENATVEGEPTEGVLAEVDRGDYDLIAMATHGHHTLADALLGSVSRTLKHQCDLPILLLRGGR